MPIVDWLIDNIEDLISRQKVGYTTCFFRTLKPTFLEKFWIFAYVEDDTIHIPNLVESVTAFILLSRLQIWYEQFLELEHLLQCPYQPLCYPEQILMAFGCSRSKYREIEKFKGCNLLFYQCFIRSIYDR